MAQRLIPGGPFVNETGSAQRLVPGGPFVNETASGSTLAVNATPAGAVAAGVSAAVSLARSFSAGPASAVAAGVSASITLGGSSVSATPASAAASGPSASVTITYAVPATPAAAVGAGVTATITTLLTGETESVIYFPLRSFMSAQSTAVDATSDLTNLRKLFPRQSQKVVMQDGSMAIEWYRFLDYLVNTFLGGPDAPTIADVQAAIEAALSQLETQQGALSMVSAQGLTNAQALAATVEVVRNNSLTGAAQIPPVSTSYYTDEF